MFDLTPLSRPVAILEILVLLMAAALLGWLLARLILNNRIHALRTAIADQEAELDDCRRARAPVTGFAPKPASLPPHPTGDLPGTSETINEPERPDESVPVAPMTDAPLTLGPERPLIDPVITPLMPIVPLAYGSSEAAVLQRIAARANELNFARIGVASATEADDLKDIVGIGPFLERKLHSLGIYTFRQVAHFIKEDIDKVNEIIEFFPGRIERDNWVDQSKAFYERKYGKKIEDEQ